jgi:hypothetical protein
MAQQADGSGEAPSSASAGAPASPPPRKYLVVRQAAFIGVGAMVGAGIFALLGAAGEVPGAAGNVQVGH